MLKAWDYPAPDEPDYDVTDEERIIKDFYQNLVEEKRLPVPGMSFEIYKIHFYRENPINPDFVRVNGKLMRRKPLFSCYEEITEPADKYGCIIRR